MNCFMYVTILSAITIFQAIQSEGQEQFPLEPDHEFKTGDCLKDLDIYKPNTNGKWPAKLLSKTFVPSALKGSSDIKWSLDIKWTAGIKNVKGFKIVLKASDFKGPICRILDYTSAITNSSPGNYSFEFKFNRIFEGRTWEGMVYALPSREETSVPIIFNTYEDTYGCNKFSPPFTYEYDGRTLMVSLTTAHLLCNYTAYIITVLNQTKFEVAHKIVPTQDNVDKLQAYMDLNICKGYYTIMASIYDPHFSDFKRCSCKSGDRCIRCVARIADKINLFPAKSCTRKVVSDERGKAEPNKLLFPLAIVIGLLFLTAVALYITHWKLSVHLTVKKRGIVLLLDDHDHHTNAVNKLVDYLNEYHLKVYLASAFLKNHDVPDEMIVISEVLKSDFILLVLSSALQKRMDAWDKQQDYVEFFKEKNSNVLTNALLEILLGSNKLYVCKFDHLAEFGCWPKPCYSLPRDLSKMVAELNGQSFSQRLAFCNCLRSNALRRELQTATKKTIMYEQSHANWFVEKYVCPTNVAVSQFVADEMTLGESIGQSEYTDPLKLKEIFTDYRDTFVNVPEESIMAQSIYSIPISERLQAINERNL